MTEREKVRTERPNLLHPYDVEIAVKKARDRIQSEVADAVNGFRTSDQVADYIIEIITDEVAWIPVEEEKVGDADRLEKIMEILKGASNAKFV